MDRNQLARQQHQLQAQRLALIRALESGAAAPVDRFDTRVKVGDLVVWHTPIDMVWQLDAISVPPAGSAPPGIIELTLSCRVPAMVGVNQPNQGFIVVGHTEAGHGSLGVSETKKEPDREAPQGPVLVGTDGAPVAAEAEQPDDGTDEPRSDGGDDDGGGTIQ